MPEPAWHGLRKTYVSTGHLGQRQTLHYSTTFIYLCA